MVAYWLHSGGGDNCCKQCFTKVGMLGLCSQPFFNLTATFGYLAEIAAYISGY